MDLLLIRHAQPEWVVDGRGLTDPPLTELGWTQARRLAAWWPEDRRPTRLWVSSALRARQTADPLAERFGLEPEIHADLVEVKLPSRFEGAAAKEVGKTIVAARQRPPEDWWGGVPGGGEPYRDFHGRVTRCLDGRLGELGLSSLGEGKDPRWSGPEHDLDERILLVGHAGTNATLTAHLLGFPPRPWIWESLLTNHTGVTHLRLRKLMASRIFALAAQSQVLHLESDEVTR